MSDTCRYCGEARPSGYSVTCGRSECQEAAYKDTHPQQMPMSDGIEYTVTVRRRRTVTETWTVTSATALDVEAIEGIVLGGEQPDGVTVALTGTDDDDGLDPTQEEITEIVDETNDETLLD